MKLRFLLVVVPLLFLFGCGIPFNIPAVGPDGTIAVFLDADRYAFTPDKGSLALIRDGKVVTVPGVTATGSCGALAWSLDGKEVAFVDTEPDELGFPKAWVINVAGVQTDSQTVSIARAGSPLIAPEFTPEGNIIYLGMDDDGNGHLFLYDRVEDITYPLLDNVLSYRPARDGESLWVIKRSPEGNLSLGHLLDYDPKSGDSYEIASFFIGAGVEQMFQMFPGAFFFDVEPNGDHVALTLFDQVLISPEPQEGDPSLYLIDAEERTVSRIALHGIAPAFSPDGSKIAYIGSADGINQGVYLYDVEAENEEELSVEGTVSGLFWIDAGHLGLVMREENDEEDSYYLLIYDLTAKETTPLIPG